jgi:outer membrane protein assembly factor BamB
MSDEREEALTRGALLLRAGVGALALWGVGGRPPAARALPSGASNWPMAAHDLRAHRFVPGEIAGLHERWRLTLAGGVAATPAVGGGRVYAASVGGEVVSVDLPDGTRRWRRRFAPARYGDRRLGFFAAPARAGRRLFVASDRVRCLDARTGRTIWVAPPLRSSREDDYFWGSPVVAGGLVLVGSGSGAESPTARGRLTAYRLADGHQAWSTAMVPPGANGGGVIAPVSVDLARGAVWTATGSPYRALPGANPGTCALVEIGLRDGRVRWTDQVFAHDLRGFDFNSAPVLLGRLAVAANKDGIFAWDRLARRRLWHTRLTPPSATPTGKADPSHGPEGGPLATDGHRLFALSNSGEASQFTIAALRPATGAVIWRRSLGGLAFAAPAAVGRSVIVATAFGSIFRLDAATGRGLDDGTLGEASACAPAVAGRLVLIGTGAAPFLPGESLLCLGRELGGG